jgi:hypothetical protein
MYLYLCRSQSNHLANWVKQNWLTCSLYTFIAVKCLVLQTVSVWEWASRIKDLSMGTSWITLIHPSSPHIHSYSLRWARGHCLTEHYRLQGCSC